MEELMGKFNFIETKVKDLYIIEPKVFGDNRGYFMETYNKNDFFEAGLTSKELTSSHLLAPLRT